jgi:hypothetical protein
MEQGGEPQENCKRGCVHMFKAREMPRAWGELRCGQKPDEKARRLEGQRGPTRKAAHVRRGRGPSAGQYDFFRLTLRNPATGNKPPAGRSHRAREARSPSRGPARKSGIRAALFELYPAALLTAEIPKYAPARGRPCSNVTPKTRRATPSEAARASPARRPRPLFASSTRARQKVRSAGEERFQPSPTSLLSKEPNRSNRNPPAKG